MRKDGAIGVDGQTAEKFHDELKGNLENLLELGNFYSIILALKTTSLQKNYHIL